MQGLLVKGWTINLFNQNTFCSLFITFKFKKMKKVFHFIETKSIHY